MLRFRRTSRTWALLFAFLAGSLSGPSGAAVELPQPFEDSVLEDTTEIRSPGHLVLFSPVREVNDEIRSASMARLPVTGQGRLYRIAADASRQEAREHYLSVLSQQGFRVLFECRGRDCGRSNVWANQIFAQATLYGRDDNQDYFVAGRIDDAGDPELMLVYTVTRANQRKYVWVEALSVGAGASVPGLAESNQRIKGPLVIPWQGGFTVNFEWTADDRRRLSEWAGDSDSVVAIVVYSELEAEETLAQSLERSQQAQAAMSKLLSRIGVSTDRQKAMIVGPAIPSDDPEVKPNRIELVVIQEARP